MLRFVRFMTYRKTKICGMFVDYLFMTTAINGDLVI